MVESRGLFFESLRVGNRLLVVFVRACLFTVSCLEKCIVWSYMTLFYYVFSFFYKNFQFCMHMLVLYSVKAEIAFLRYDCSRSHVWRNVQCNAIHRLLLCFSFVFLFFFFFHLYTHASAVFSLENVPMFLFDFIRNFKFRNLFIFMLDCTKRSEIRTCV